MLGSDVERSQERGQHSALPWEAVGGNIYSGSREVYRAGSHMTRDERRTNAAFVIRATSCHDALVRACSRLLHHVKTGCRFGCGIDDGRVPKSTALAEAALALAEGGEA